MRPLQPAPELEVMDRKEREMAAADRCDGTCGCPGCEDCADQGLGLVICAECGHMVAEKEVAR